MQIASVPVANARSIIALPPVLRIPNPQAASAVSKMRDAPRNSIRAPTDFRVLCPRRGGSLPSGFPLFRKKGSRFCLGGHTTPSTGGRQHETSRVIFAGLIQMGMASAGCCGRFGIIRRLKTTCHLPSDSPHRVVSDVDVLPYSSTAFDTDAINIPDESQSLADTSS